MGGRLQKRGHGREGAGLPWSLSVPGGDSGEAYPAFNHGRVTFRYQNSETKQFETRTLVAVEFLHLVLQHVLPKGFRRARNFGFLHPNSGLVRLVQLLKRVIVLTPQPRPAVRCKCCGGPMKIVRTRIRSLTHLRKGADREQAM